MLVDPRKVVRVTTTSSDPVEVQIMGHGFLDFFTVRDISGGGMGILVPHRFQGCNLKHEVELLISLPAERPFLAKGVIIHREEVGKDFFGISFTELRRSDRMRIDQYVARRLEQSAPDEG